jgi:hypothetical protein
MNHRGELLLLLPAGGHVWSAGKNRRDVAVINEMLTVPNKVRR